MMGFSSQIHDGGDESDIDTVEEIATAFLPLLVHIADTTEVNLSDTTFFQRRHRLLDIAVAESPEVGKVVHQSVRNNTQCHIFSFFRIYLHQTVYGIIERRISTNDDNGLITIVDKHSDEPFYALLILALHKVVIHALLLEHLLYFFPALVTSPASSRAIKQPPFILVYHCLFFVI